MRQVIRNARGERLDYTFEAGAKELKKQNWIVLLGHGVTGNKDRPVVVDTAHALNAAGFDTLRFSFAGNGASEGDFRDATITKETGDLEAVLDAVAPHYGAVAYAGHSMGGAVGVLVAARDCRIRRLISIAGMVDTRRFAETEFGETTPDTGAMWDDPECPLSSAFMRDLRETVGSTATAAEAINTPWLLVHGTEDDVVPPDDTDAIKRRKGDAVEVVRVRGADHSFEAPEHKKALTKAVVDWLSRNA